MWRSLWWWLCHESNVSSSKLRYDIQRFLFLVSFFMGGWRKGNKDVGPRKVSFFMGADGLDMVGKHRFDTTLLCSLVPS